MRQASIAIALAAAALVDRAAPSAQGVMDPISWTLALEPAGATVRPGGTITLALTATIDDGWHLYSLKLDPGGPIPTAITLPAGQVFTLAGDVIEPLPKSVFEPNFNQVLDYHVEKVTFAVPVKSAATATPGRQAVRVAASYQTCNDRLCLPARQVFITADVQVVAALLLAATVNAAGPTWSVARSRHFEVYATGASSRAADALVMFEQAHAFFASYLSLPESTRPPMRVLVFSGDKEFAPYRANESASAFYQPAHERDYIVMKDFDADAFHIVAHEYAHAALGLKGIDLPPWLSEGLAEFFSSVSLLGDKARLGGAPEGRPIALRPAGLMSVPELLGVTRNSEAYNASNHAGLFYAESWALTHMLLVDARYRDGAARLVALAQTGADSTDALRQVYGKTSGEVERDLRAYITRGHYAFFTVDFPRTAAPAITPPAAVAPFDAALVLADMLASQIGKDLETRAMLDAMAEQQPDHVALIELRAFFELRTRGIASADPYFRRAVDRGSQNPTVLAEYALRIGEKDPDRASALLSRAMALAPGDAEIRIHAAAMSIRKQMPEEALALIAPIAHVPSNLQFEYYQIVANGRAMTGDFDAAAAAAARVVAAARTPTEVQFAATFLSTVGGPPDMSKLVEGRLKNLNCDGAMPILEVAAAGGVIRLAIDDPAQIVIAGGRAGDDSGGKGMKLNLDCGGQDLPVRVGYSDVKPPDGTAGRVRFLDLRKKTPES